MNSTLLKTKLYRPLVRPELVSRPYLMGRLDEGFNSKLTVVSAPAGYGKTTLVSTWASECQCPVAWLSLDKEDNDPVRFLIYVIAALQTIKPDLGQEILSVLQSAQPVIIANLLPELINQLVDIQASFTLVLDDYHAITSPEIHDSITYIIDHQPPKMHLLLTTRIDPPLPLPKLRGRGQLTELRQADLRFSEEETIVFLKQGINIELSPGDVNILVNRTEGWIASLQMAAISMRNKQDISSFISGFGGSHEYIVDYFASEILNNLPEQERSFMVKTSFLDQMCGSLCDEVTGQASSQLMLERLQDANLFLIPLDDEHIWYRYHQLFADFLYKCLVQTERSRVPELHLRASQWFEQNEFPQQAVEHAFLASDYPRAARLLEDAADHVLGHGEQLWMLKWIEKLPQAQMEAPLRLNIIRTAIFVSTGLVKEAEGALQSIEAHLQSQALDPSIQDYVIGRVTALRAMLAIERGDVDNAKRNAILALGKLPTETRLDAPWRADSLLTLGLSNIAQGDLDEARYNLDMAIQAAHLAGRPFTYLDVMVYQVDVLWSHGLLKEAAELCQEGLNFIDEHNLGWAPMSGEVLIRWCLLLCERYDLNQAEVFLRRGLDLIRRGGVPWAMAWAYHVKMFYLVAQGDLLAAEAASQEAGQLTKKTNLPTRIVSDISALKVLIWVRLGRLDEAEVYLKKRGVWIGSEISYPYHREYQSLVALLIAKGDIGNAETILKRLIDWAEATKQDRTLICARVLQSMAYATQKSVPKALSSLALAMDLAEPEGYCLAILEGGQAVLPLLYVAAQKGIHADFATRLLGIFKESNPNLLEKSDPQKRQVEILAPLRPREIEVLRLVSDGQTNKEIAQALHISLRTVKFHMTCILTKLGVDNRIQAVAKARILGVI